MKLLTLFGWLITTAHFAETKPVKGCSGVQGNYFVGDTGDPCIYYWCEGGSFLQWTFPCSYGAAVPYGYFGQIVPCIDNSRTCHGGAPKPSIVRDPIRPAALPYTIRPTQEPSHTQSPLYDDTPTLSHRTKHVPEKQSPDSFGMGTNKEHQPDDATAYSLPNARSLNSDEVKPKGNDMRTDLLPRNRAKRTTATPAQSTLESDQLDWIMPTVSYGGEDETQTQTSEEAAGALFNNKNQGQQSSSGMEYMKTTRIIPELKTRTPPTTRPTTRYRFMQPTTKKAPDKRMEPTTPTMMRRATTTPQPSTSTTPLATTRKTPTITPTTAPTTTPTTTAPTTTTPTTTPTTTTSTTTPIPKTIPTTTPTTSTTQTTPTTTTTRPTTQTTSTTSITTPTTQKTTPTTPTTPITTIKATTITSPTTTTTTSTTTTTTFAPTTTPHMTTSSTTDGFDGGFDFGFESEGMAKGDSDSLPRVIDHNDNDMVAENEAEVKEKHKILPEITTERGTSPSPSTGRTPAFLKRRPPTIPVVIIPVTSPTRPTTKMTAPPTTPIPTTTTTTTATTTTTRPTTKRYVPTMNTTEQPTPTSPTEPTSDSCEDKMGLRGGGQVITRMFPQHHIVGGERRSNFTFQIGVIHVTIEIKMASMCYLACDLHPGCAGFDWDIVGATCWFHTESRECGSAVTHIGGPIAHYRLESCEDTLEQYNGERPDDGLGTQGSEEGISEQYNEERPDDRHGVQGSEELTNSTAPSAPRGYGSRDNLQADAMDHNHHPSGYGLSNSEWERSGSQRIFNMVINHGRSRGPSNGWASSSEWEHGAESAEPTRILD